MRKDNPVGALLEELQRAGASRAYLKRLRFELSDHLEDLREDALASGLSPHEADTRASLALGIEGELTKVLLAQQDTLTWAPEGWRTDTPPAGVAAARWGVSIGGSLCVVGGMLTAMVYVVMSSPLASW